jgi:DNA-binding Lrp family transcriptional regulator
MDKEHRLLDVLSRDAGLSQRQVAKETGLSLGMVNLVLARLVKTGAIKVVNLNGRTARYLLTPAGVAEKTRRAYEYLHRTVETFRDLRLRIDGVIAEMHAAGVREFIIHGEGEVADIAELCLARTQLPDVSYRRENGELPRGADARRSVLNCSLEPLGAGYVGVSVLERLVRGSGEAEEISPSAQRDDHAGEMAKSRAK